MAAPAACWIWCPVEATSAFKHPADLPVNDEAAAKAAFLDFQRGPRVARISPATMLQHKGSLAMIAQKGATREVPKSMILPWYEGLLLLEELEAVQGQPGHIQASWWDDELKDLLEKERSKFQTGRLNGALYTEKRLLSTAVTGLKYTDGQGKSFDYRRDGVKADDNVNLPDGEEGDGYYKVREITGYIPPWEAFHHEKCGFYQDFYQVRWDYPFSEVDYATVENGSTETIGATWEPDECLPSHMDAMRLAAKKGWITARRDKDSKLARDPSGLKRRSTNESPQGVMASSSPSVPPPAAAAVTVKRERVDDVPAGPPAKMGKIRKDGKPLEQDLFHTAIGHDFTPEKYEQQLGQIRAGWPKKPKDYPPGYAVASPPGFCFADCDCMDDQRPQKAWETKKAWLEEPTRHNHAHSAIQSFSDQIHFVRRRGQVSKMCFFESQQGRFADQSHARAANDLSVEVVRALQAVLTQLPINSLSDVDEVQIPARAFFPNAVWSSDPIKNDMDYEPLRYTSSTASGAALPSWVKIDQDHATISISRQPTASELPLQLRVDLSAAEGSAGKATLSIVAQSFTSSASPWFIATTQLVQKFNDSSRYPLERGVYAGLYDHFSEIFDFNRRTSRDKTLGAWMTTVGRILRLLRSACGASLSLAARAS